MRENTLSTEPLVMRILKRKDAAAVRFGLFVTLSKMDQCSFVEVGKILLDFCCLLLRKLLDDSTGFQSKEGIHLLLWELCLASEHQVIQLTDTPILSLQQQHNIMEDLQYIFEESQVGLQLKGCTLCVQTIRLNDATVACL